MAADSTPDSDEVTQHATALMEAVRRQYSAKGAKPEDGWVSPILRLDGVRTMLRLRFDQRMGNAMAQGEMEDADETTLWFYKDLVDCAIEDIGLTDAEVYGVYRLLDPGVP